MNLNHFCSTIEGVYFKILQTEKTHNMEHIQWLLKTVVKKENEDMIDTNVLLISKQAKVKIISKKFLYSS